MTPKGKNDKQGKQNGRVGRGERRRSVRWTAGGHRGGVPIGQANAGADIHRSNGHPGDTSGLRASPSCTPERCHQG